MKKNILLTVLMLFSITINLFAEINVNEIFNGKQKKQVNQQNQSIVCRLSPMTLKLLSVIKAYDNKNDFLQDSKVTKEFLVKKINNDIFVGGLIKIDNELSIDFLRSLGVKIGTNAGNILSVQIPLDNLEKVSNLTGLEYMQIDEPVAKKLDKVRSDVSSEYVNSGVGLPKGYNGTDVVVGIVDNGFDYTHLNFLREDASEYRVLRVWDQSVEDGTPPQGFSYGNELSTSNAILNEYTDNIYQSHGTHVSGIAAGCGYKTDGKYKGIAPDADIIFVSLASDQEEMYNTGQSTILDGINYVFQTASSLGKPAVVNLSLGTHIGPHDGTSLFDEACDALVGAGKIIVGSAGNEGDVPLHIEHTFSQSSPELHTIMEIEPVYWPDQPAMGIVDIWGDAGKVYDFVISLINIETEARVSSEVFSTNQQFNSTISLTGSDLNDCEIYLYISGSEFNGKPRIFLFVQTESSNKVLLSIQSNSGKINLWNHGLGGGYPFDGNGITGISNGNQNVTIGEIGGTGKNIITVGSYTTKEQFTNLNGDVIENNFLEDNISPFSSLGPTADGRIKPDITAPGAYVVSSVNSFDFLMQKGGYLDFLLAAETTIDGSYYWNYGGMEGTSMSSPVVVGVVALLLEAKPNLNPDRIKNILKATARKDSYTGTLPPDGNNTWGFGKIDALVALEYTVTSVEEQKDNDFDIIIYPNPADDYFFASSNSDLNVSKIIITDVLGNTVYQDYDYSLFENISTSQFSQNIYFVKLFGDNQVYTNKLIINK